ncbi:putative receptor-like protein kinase [Hibiscus syriacus]|uniref:Receptor-like protein kinase n=1 Tax=Hibiscus syriacus TaxID=106335 RepID=A0A6A2Z398_HIBSY|nr:probable receptor-like protein kinase At2g23200 [Hibiscus syriacus]KAE8686033.1 putative receptor-like protein kinase [Hibiscus syriacus]
MSLDRVKENFLQKYCKSMKDKLHQPLILLLFLVFFSSFQLPSSAYTLPDKYFINCGSNINLNIASRAYVGDMNSSLVSFTKQKSFVFDNKRATKTPSDLYQTARIFWQKSSYVLGIDGNGSYLVRLHFFSSMNLSAAVFDVSASRFVLLHNFTVQNRNNTAVIKEFILSIPIGDFSINFVPQGSSFAFVNAIEVFPAPPDFINDEASNGNNGILSQALHTIHRINVGGPTLTPQNDTLLRTWLPDDGYLYNALTAKNIQGLAGQPNYLTPVDKFIAPAPVYMTAKEMNIDTDRPSNNFNVTWSYDVTPNARYLVRVHFCDVVSLSLSNFQFLFYIDSHYSQKINPYNITGQLATPFYVDFVVDSDDSGFMNISVGPDSSSLMKTAFLNGVEIMEMVGVSDLVTVNVKPKQMSLFVIVGLVLGGLVLVCTFGGLLCIRSKCRKSKSVETPEWRPLTAYKGSTHSNRKMSQQSKLSREGTTNASPVPDLNLGLKIPLFEIQLATSNFDTKLLIGKGGFGDVYRGTLRTGIRVAVKRRKPGSGQGLPEFQTEIMVLSRIRHLHLVSLIGYCDEMSEMILVYEFMEKGTLREHLYNSELPCLPWKQRLEICIGAARGLNYLHKGATGGIIHRDVKSTNILLDENLVAKVADFGLSRSGPPDQSHVSTNVKGTFGYLDPDYFRTQQLTEKSDVYSFGVVLLEVLCARPAIDPTLPRDQVSLSEWGLLCKKKELLEQIIDPSIKLQINPNSLRKFADIVEKCLEEDAADRPTMSDVAWDLEYALQLQQTAVAQLPHEDSMSNVSAMFLVSGIQRLPSMTAQFHSSDTSIIREGDSDSVPSASEVFSQLRIDDAR